MGDYPEISSVRRAKYNLLRFLPGRYGRRYQAKHEEVFLHAELRKRQAGLAAEFDAALEKSKGKIAIDLGANLGVFTSKMAAHASKVFAFEPDPWTCELLRKNVEGLANVEVIEAAAGDGEGVLPLYRHVGYAKNPEGLSQSSSILAENRDIDPQEASAQVRVIDFVDFLRSCNGQVGVLKIDIEGGELALLKALLDSDVLERIDYIFCETHERLMPAAADDFAALRRKAAGIEHPKINLDWF
ncbi:FkbM family methyltransferase [Nioella aestuarii]|uniref:FkbM family methyltransferase n=1 Tax=Nioella aestuarii TaxID=1662864 RepID=UPI003D7F633F